MSPSIKRTIAYSALACATIAVAYLPPRTRTFDILARFYTSERYLVQRLNSLAREEADALVLLEQRDRALSALEPLGPHFFFADPALPERLTSATRALLDSPDSLSTHADAPRIAIAAVADTIRQFRSVIRFAIRGRRIQYVPPSATDGATCLTVAAVGPSAIQDMRDTPDDQFVSLPWNRSSLLGLCEFYHRFGPPSSTVEDWLLAGALDDDGPLRSRCARRDVLACETLVFRPQESHVAGIHFAIENRGPLATRPSFDFTDERFLIATIDSLGVDSFQRFWQDERAVGESFEAHFGVSMVQWVQSWYEMNSRGQREQTGPGPRVKALLLTGATIAGSLIWAVVARSGVLARTRVGRK